MCMSKSVPNGWANDALTVYLDGCQSNQLAAFANKGQAVRDLIQIDALFERLLRGAINPRPINPMLFMLRAHSAYRAGVSVLMAGQLYESQAVLRLCLEHAAYGHFIGADNARMERWLRRGETNQNRNAVRREFHSDKLKAHFHKHSKALGDTLEQLTSKLIEFGAHPNEAGYSANLSVVRDVKQVHFNAMYLQGDVPQLDYSMKIAGQVGLWALLAMQTLYAERYELLGIREELDQLTRGF
jgi:hypothetical protein